MPCSKVWIHSHIHTWGLEDMQFSIQYVQIVEPLEAIWLYRALLTKNGLDPPAKDADTFHVLGTSSTLSYCPPQFYKQTCRTGLKMHGSHICTYLGSLPLITGWFAANSHNTLRYISHKPVSNSRQQGCLCLCVCVEFRLWQNLKAVWLWQQWWMSKVTSRLITPTKPDWMDVKSCFIILVWSYPKADTRPCYLNQVYPL